MGVCVCVRSHGVILTFSEIEYVHFCKPNQTYFIWWFRKSISAKLSSKCVSLSVLKWHVTTLNTLYTLIVYIWNVSQLIKWQAKNKTTKRFFMREKWIRNEFKGNYSRLEFQITFPLCALNLWLPSILKFNHASYHSTSGVSCSDLFSFCLEEKYACILLLRLTIYQIFIARTNVICQLDGVHFLQFIFRARRQWTNPMVYIAE